MKSYCPHCGFSNNYLYNRPLNCAKCAKSLSFAVVQSKQNLPKQPLCNSKQAIIIDDNYKDENTLLNNEDLTVEIPNITKLSFSIQEGLAMPKRITLEDAIFSNPKPKENKEIKPVKFNAKKAFKDLMSRAKSRDRNSSSSIEIGGS